MESDDSSSSSAGEEVEEELEVLEDEPIIVLDDDEVVVESGARTVPTGQTRSGAREGGAGGAGGAPRAASKNGKVRVGDVLITKGPPARFTAQLGYEKTQQRLNVFCRTSKLNKLIVRVDALSGGGNNARVTVMMTSVQTGRMPQGSIKVSRELATCGFLVSSVLNRFQKSGTCLRKRRKSSLRRM
jgi:hypothetical protein